MCLHFSFPVEVVARLPESGLVPRTADVHSITLIAAKEKLAQKALHSVWTRPPERIRHQCVVVLLSTARERTVELISECRHGTTLEADALSGTADGSDLDESRSFHSTDR